MSGPATPAGTARLMVTVLAGGYGGAKLSHGLALASVERMARGLPGLDLSIVVNTGDDLVLHGLHVSPDLDTVMYTLAGLVDPEHGWGVRDETWSAARMLERYGAETWFRLGDQDLATHILRTAALRAGERLSEVTADLCRRLALPARLLPMTDDAVRTQVRGAEGWLEFQDYFVRRGQRDQVLEVRHTGIASARPTPEALDAIAACELIVLAPSNPFVSIGTILALPGMRDAIHASPARVVAISPIVAGRALRGPADRMFESLGGVPSAAGFVAHYEGHHPGLVDDYVVDLQDADTRITPSRQGVGITAFDTLMVDDAARRRLAEAILERFARR